MCPSRRLPRPRERTLGDALCKLCPKWDATAGAPRATLGGHDIALTSLLRDIQTMKILPEAGGILDQDAELWDQLSIIASSTWWASQHNV